LQENERDVRHTNNTNMTVSPEYSSTRPTVLVVDDEAGPRDALKVILQPFFHIRSAATAKSALSILSKEPIDLITLDQKLPDCQGIDLLQDIKRTYSEVEVIIVTGYGSLKSAMEGIRHGAAGYLLKPFNVTELITLINQTLDKKKRLDFLRHILHTSPELWRTGEESTSAWQRLKTGYYSYGKISGDAETQQDDTDLLSLLSDILEAKDKHLLNHSSRVSLYSTLLANRLSLSVTDQKLLAMGAFLHDIGKASLPAYKFAEDQTFPSGEASLCREHPERGAQMVASLGLPPEVSQIVLSHHERWDGQGYPHGLHGEQIPLLARIVSIAQTFDHLTAEIPGRSPLSVEVALRQLSTQYQTHFDPTLLSLFMNVVKDYTPSLSAMAIAAAA